MNLVPKKITVKKASNFPCKHTQPLVQEERREQRQENIAFIRD
jgi:hypothetical protein